MSARIGPPPPGLPDARGIIPVGHRPSPGPWRQAPGVSAHIWSPLPFGPPLPPGRRQPPDVSAHVGSLPPPVDARGLRLALPPARTSGCLCRVPTGQPLRPLASGLRRHERISSRPVPLEGLGEGVPRGGTRAAPHPRWPAAAAVPTSGTAPRVYTRGAPSGGAGAPPSRQLGKRRVAAGTCQKSRAVCTRGTRFPAVREASSESSRYSILWPGHPAVSGNLRTLASPCQLGGGVSLLTPNDL